MKGKSTPVLYLLFERGYEPTDLIEYYPRATLYRYFKKWQQARVKANTFMKGV